MTELKFRTDKSTEFLGVGPRKDTVLSIVGVWRAFSNTISDLRVWYKTNLIGRFRVKAWRNGVHFVHIAKRSTRPILKGTHSKVLIGSLFHWEPVRFLKFYFSQVSRNIHLVVLSQWSVMLTWMPLFCQWTKVF